MIHMRIAWMYINWHKLAESIGMFMIHMIFVWRMWLNVSTILRHVFSTFTAGSSSKISRQLQKHRGQPANRQTISTNSSYKKSYTQNVKRATTHSSHPVLQFLFHASEWISSCYRPIQIHSALRASDGRKVFGGCNQKCKMKVAFGWKVCGDFTALSCYMMSKWEISYFFCEISKGFGTGRVCLFQALGGLKSNGFCW